MAWDRQASTLVTFPTRLSLLCVLERRQIVNLSFPRLLAAALREEKTSRLTPGRLCDRHIKNSPIIINNKPLSQQPSYLSNNANTLHTRSTAVPACTSAETTSGHHQAAPQIAQTTLFPTHVDSFDISISQSSR